MSFKDNVVKVPSTSNVLEISNVAKAFGGVKAVNGVSFKVKEGAITGLIGPNGAGKSTMVNLISGFLRPDSGSIRLRGKEIAKSPSYEVASQGLIRTFQIARDIRKLTVLENLMLAPQGQFGEKTWQALFFRGRIREEEDERLRRAVDFLKQFSLYDLRDEYAGNLSGGQKKLLDLARAMMSKPQVMLLDEPMAGVNPTLTKTLAGHIKEINRQGVTFLLIEHNLGIVEDLCDHVVVMAEGQVLAEGNMSTLRQNQEVVTAYLGG